MATLAESLRTRFDLPVGFRERAIRQAFASGVAPVDRLLNGGFPRAALSEISGPASSNRMSLAVSVVVGACEADECCVWIDAAGTLDPESVEQAGAKLDRLLWINCRGEAEHALKAADLLLQAGGFGLMIFDLADVPERAVRRISMASWFRLRHAAEETGTALIAVTPAPQTRSCSSVSVELTREKSLWRGRLLRGLSSRLETRKHFRSQAASFASVL